MVTLPVADAMVILLCVPFVFCKVMLPAGAGVHVESGLKTARKFCSVFETTVIPGGSVVTVPAKI